MTANLLSQSFYGEVIRRCWDCLSWVGRCKKGHFGRIARDEACNEFTSKYTRKTNKR